MEKAVKQCRGTTNPIGFADIATFNPSCATAAVVVAVACAVVAVVCATVAAVCAPFAAVDAVSATVSAVRIPTNSSNFFPRSVIVSPASLTSPMNFLLLFTTNIVPTAAPAVVATGTIVSMLSARTFIPFCAAGRNFTKTGCITSV